MKTIFSCIGTRADIIKMSPILRELIQASSLKSFVCVSGQHKELAKNVIEELNIHYDTIFDIMKDEQTPDYVLSILLNKFTEQMRKTNPSLVLVHGDTTTALAGAIAASYLQIPIFHVEAGLRTYSSTPFPEELHRHLITKCSSYFACPDKFSMQNLLSERVNSNNIYITGNSIADVLYDSISESYQFKCQSLVDVDFETSKEIVVTMHRSESTPEVLKRVCKAIKSVAEKDIGTKFFWPIHPNPRISKTLVTYLSDVTNVTLLPPLSVFDMHNLLFRSALVLTDSAGLQEEAFLLEKPTLVLRERSERMDFLDASKSKLFNPMDSSLNAEIEKALIHTNPATDFSVQKKLYGKTGASKQIVNLILDNLHLGGYYE